MAVPKTIECTCRDGSLQTRQVIQRLLHKQPNPYIVSLPHGIDVPRILIAKLTEQF